MDTIGYYDTYGDEYVRNTVNVEFGRTWARFLAYLPEHASILDLGCGSGRDARAFMEMGYAVTAVDGSEKMCELAGAYLGQPVRQLLFTDLAADGEYDGIWACSSILHLRKKELRQVLASIHRALRGPGIFYTSFKLGEFEGERHGRTFTDFTEESFRAFLEPQALFTILDCWQSGDVRPGRETEKWLNLIMKKA